MVGLSGEEGAEEWAEQGVENDSHRPVSPLTALQGAMADTGSGAVCKLLDFLMFRTARVSFLLTLQRKKPRLMNCPRFQTWPVVDLGFELLPPLSGFLAATPGSGYSPGGGGSHVLRTPDYRLEVAAVDVRLV